MSRYMIRESDEAIARHYDDYLHNLREYARCFKCLWLHPDHIFTDIDIEHNGWHTCHDPYLKDTMNDRLALGRDILKNGTYWHLHLKEEDGIFHLRDGIHRLWSIKKLVETGEWPEDRMLFCITRTPVGTSEDIRMRLPVNVTGDFQLKYPGAYWNAGHLVGDISMEVTTGMGHALSYVVMYSALLRDAMYRSGRIGPSEIINKEDKWHEFIKE